MRASRSKVRAVAVVAVLTLASLPALAGVEEGIAAYKKADYPQARAILEPLADDGNGNAQYHLGLMYKRGVGYPRNYVHAYVWFSLSAAQGVANAATDRDALEAQMTPEQRAEAQQRATDWRPASQRVKEAPPAAPSPAPSSPSRPSKGPASGREADSNETMQSYLSEHVREEDSDMTLPEIMVGNCVLTVRSEHILRHSSVQIVKTVRLRRVTRADRSDLDDGLNVAIWGTDSGDVETVRSSGTRRTGRLLQVPVQSDFDFEKFAKLVEQQVAMCKR